jgi:hypothetical protein
MSNNKETYRGLSKANQLLYELKELYLPFLSIDAKVSIDLALKRVEEILEPFNESSKSTEK